MKLYEIAKAVEGTIIGSGFENLEITELSPIDAIKAGTLVFAEGEQNFQKADQSTAAAILVGKGITTASKPLIQVPHAFKAFIQLLSILYPTIPVKTGIHPTAIVGSDIIIGKEVSIGPYVVIESGSIIGDGCVIKGHVHIGHHVTIGANSVLHSHITVYDHCKIGEQVIIHASSVIGSDGFGYHYTDGHHMKIPHVGNVIIENKVEIGANSVVDRATLGSTHIGEGTKIDNFVQIAHSVKLGKHNILCGFTGIAGSSTSGDNVIFAANVGVSDHVVIEDNVILGARAGVPSRKRLTADNVYLGTPARPRKKAIEQELSVSRLPIMRKNLQLLREKIEALIQRLKKLEEA